MVASSLTSPATAAAMQRPATPSSTSSRAEVVERYRRMRKQRASSTPRAVDENRQPLSSSRHSTPKSVRSSIASPLSPTQDNSTTTRSSFSFSKPSPKASPLAVAPSPSSVTGSARRERLARHARLLGSRGSARSCLTPRNNNNSSSSTSVASTTATPKSGITNPLAKTTTTNTPLYSSSRSATKTPASVGSISDYYSYEKPSSSTKKKPPKTPASTKVAASTSGSASASSSKESEVSKRVRERRARGAKKLFILATSPTIDTTTTSNDDNLTPLERHLNEGNNNIIEEYHGDCPSVVSDVSTLTMSTLSSLARDKRKFSRDRRYSASKLYARATGGSSSSVQSVDGSNPKTTTPTRGRSPVRKRDTGTPVRSGNTNNSAGVKRSVVPASSSSTTSGSETTGTPLTRRATTMQKAKRLARSRSLSRQRTPTSGSASSTTKSASAAATPRTYESSPATRSVSSAQTPMSVESVKSNASSASALTPTSRARNRAASIQRARKTLARTKANGKLPVGSSVSPIPPPSRSPTFVAREKVEARARSLSIAPQTRRNLDKRTARLKFHNEFANQVMMCQEEIGQPPPIHKEGDNLTLRGTNGISVFVRKRPIFDYETSVGDFDVVFTEKASQQSDAVVIHSCNMHADMKQKLVKPIRFSCSAAFDESYTNEQIYNHVGKPLVRLAATNGGLATILTFGQTGSGKSHTITGMEERVCQDVFRMISKKSQIQVQFVELAGKQVKDLLGNNVGEDVKLVDQPDGSVLLLNAVTEKAHSPKELHDAIRRGKRNRATEATDKNDVSSRSHSVLQIKIISNEEQRGVLTIIDCAGSERRNDSMYHTRDRQKESTEINASLWALKECIRARASGGGSSNNGPIPYRSSNLTRILRQSLERDDAQLCVIATIAPNATDTEHSIETLKTVMQLSANDNAIQELEPRVFEQKLQLPPELSKWDHSQLAEWLSTKGVRPQQVPGDIDGKQVMRMSRIQLNNTFYGGDNSQKADRLFLAMRHENEKIARANTKARLEMSQGATYEL